MDSLSLLWGIFPTQGLNPGCPHCRRILYQLSHKGSPTLGTVVILGVSFKNSTSVEAAGEGTSSPHPYSCLGNLMDGGAWWVKIAGQPLATQLPPPHRGSREPVLLTSYTEYRTLSNFFNTLASDHLHNCHHHHRHHHQYPLEDSLTELMAGHHTLLSSRGKQKEVPPGMFRWPICPRVPRLSVLISWTHSKHPRALRRISSGCQATGLHSADPARSWIPSPLFLVL